MSSATDTGATDPDQTPKTSTPAAGEPYLKPSKEPESGSQGRSKQTWPDLLSQIQLQVPLQVQPLKSGTFRGPGLDIPILPPQTGETPTLTAPERLSQIIKDSTYLEEIPGTLHRMAFYDQEVILQAMPGSSTVKIDLTSIPRDLSLQHLIKALDWTRQEVEVAFCTCPFSAEDEGQYHPDPTSHLKTCTYLYVMQVVTSMRKVEKAFLETPMEEREMFPVHLPALSELPTPSSSAGMILPASGGTLHSIPTEGPSLGSMSAVPSAGADASAASSTAPSATDDLKAPLDDFRLMVAGLRDIRVGEEDEALEHFGLISQAGISQVISILTEGMQLAISVAACYRIEQIQTRKLVKQAEKETWGDGFQPEGQAEGQPEHHQI